jgi:hypothetical protein
MRLLDVNDTTRVEEILELIQKQLTLQMNDNIVRETLIVLNYNGCDLKPNWTLSQLSIPSGAILRCFHRKQQTAHLHIHCGFNRKILRLFDAKLSMDTTIGTLRCQVSDILGLPLSLFCLEKLSNKQRLYDTITLNEYDIQIHDHIYLQVWREHEKFINACVKGFSQQYSHDDLTRHYQVQVALHIAAFHGKQSN